MKSMTRVAKVIGACATACFALNATAESELSIVPSIAYQNKSLSFDQKYSFEGASLNDAEFSVVLPVLSGSLTVAYDRFFSSIKYEVTASPTSTTTNETDRAIEDGIVSNLITTSGSRVDVEREDFSFTVGIRTWKSLNLFAGYLSGKTSLTPDPFCADPTSQDGVSDCRSVNRAFQQYFAGRHGNYDQSDYKQDYIERGPFLGVSYGIAAGEAGTLSFSLAYAHMDGEYTDNANDRDNLWANPPLDPNATSTLLKFNYEGTTEGLSVGATWTGSLGDYSSYFTDLRYQRYEMEGEDATGAAVLSGISLRTVEQMVGLTLGIKFYF